MLLPRFGSSSSVLSVAFNGYRKLSEQVSRQKKVQPKKTLFKTAKASTHRPSRREKIFSPETQLRQGLMLGFPERCPMSESLLSSCRTTVLLIIFFGVNFSFLR